MVPIMAAPLIPKVGGVAVGGLMILLDDLLLAASCVVGMLTILAAGAVRGSAPITLSPVATALAYLILYKAVLFLVLGTALPWTDFDGIGEGVLLTEGILVLCRLSISWIVLVLAMHVYRTKAGVESALMAMLACASIVVAGGVAQFALLGHRVLTSTFRPIAFIDRKFTDVENPWLDQFASGHEHLGAFCVLTAALTAGLSLTAWRQGFFTLAWLRILGGLALFVLLFSSSRGSWIGGLTAFGVLTLVFLRLASLTRVVAMAGLVVIGIAALPVVTGVDIGGYVDLRVQKLIATVTEGEILDDSGIHRIATFLQLWLAFENYPITGLGPGGAGRIAEGQYIRELVEGGVIGFAIFSLILWRVLRTAFDCYRYGTDRLTQGLGIGLLGGTVGLMAQALFTELFIVIKVSTPFWLLVAIAERANALRDVDLNARGQAAMEG